MSPRFSDLTPKQRAADLSLLIDPGFVHHRLILSIVGAPGRELIDRQIDKVPKEPQWQLSIRVDHVYAEVLLAWCDAFKAPPLSLLLNDIKGGQSPTEGSIFCSTEVLLPCSDFGSAERAASQIAPSPPTERHVELRYSVSRVKADTLKWKLTEGHRISVVAALDVVQDDLVTFRPLLMGFPMLRAPSGQEVGFSLMTLEHSFFEHRVEDFDEFSKVVDVPLPQSPEPMRKVSESAFKWCLSRILGDEAPEDWGGETSDYFSAHVAVGGKQRTAAFLLKGPAQFRPMNLRHLGKNCDQIHRLAREPADILFVQHCHDIGREVRETLRNFAVQPGRPRRYCCIDGRESLRLLQTFGLYEDAVKRTEAERARRQRRREK